MPTRYQCKKRGHINRVIEASTLAGDFNPYRLLCSAILAQAATDCDMIAHYGEEGLRKATSKSNIAPATDMTVAALEIFICSDWIDALLSWQNEIRPDAVAENLWKRLHP